MSHQDTEDLYLRAAAEILKPVLYSSQDAS